MDTDSRVRKSYDIDIFKGDCYITTLEDFISLDGAINRATVMYGGMGYIY